MQNGSKVSHFAQGLPDFEYDEEKPYAEVRCTPSSFPRGAIELTARPRAARFRPPPAALDGNAPVLPFKAAQFRRRPESLRQGTPGTPRRQGRREVWRRPAVPLQGAPRFWETSLPFAQADGPSNMARQVLAIRKALSIQAHPDKKLAQKLHAERPDVYKGERSVCRAHLIEPT